jgi:hypothetical protein
MEMFFVNVGDVGDLREYLRAVYISKGIFLRFSIIFPFIQPIGPIGFVRHWRFLHGCHWRYHIIH